MAFYMIEGYKKLLIVKETRVKYYNFIQWGMINEQ
jgi:hypothetical protein